MIQRITGIKIAGDRKIPHSTQVILANTNTPGFIGARLCLPWQKKPRYLGDLPIVGTEVVLPLKLAFLCHAREDKKEVEKVGSRLLKDGFLTWYDKKDLLPGDHWEQKIEEEIENCDYFLAFLSTRSVRKTGYVQRELRYALAQHDHRPLRQRFIIPILLDDCPVPRELSDIHFLKMWEPGAYGKLRSTLQGEG